MLGEVDRPRRPQEAPGNDETYINKVAKLLNTSDSDIFLDCRTPVAGMKAGQSSSMTSASVVP